MTDNFGSFAKTETSPLVGGFAVTPSDSTDLVQVTRALCVAAAGTVAVTFKDGSEVDLYLAAGVPIPVRAVRVRATGTTATGIVGLV